MNLYLTHSSGYDYQTELYAPIKQTLGKNHDIFFPHDDANVEVKSNEIIARSDFVLAEVSYPSTGQGIELGWANAGNIPIVCFYRYGAKPSSSLRFISETLMEYDSLEEMTKKLVEYFEER